MTNYFQVKDWAKFQHYKDRNPPWIKLQTDTFRNYEFSRLQDASKLLAVCIWTIAAASNEGKVPADLAYIKSQCNLGNMVTEDNIKELIEQGYIIYDSEVLAGCKQSAIPERETEGETETEKKRTPLPPEGVIAEVLPPAGMALGEMLIASAAAQKVFKAMNETREAAGAAVVVTGSPEVKPPAKRTPKVSLAAWEQQHGQITIDLIADWVTEKELDREKISKEIEVFRTKCEAKAYTYASFPAAIKAWIGNETYGNGLKKFARGGKLGGMCD